MKIQTFRNSQVYDSVHLTYDYNDGEEMSLFQEDIDDQLGSFNESIITVVINNAPSPYDKLLDGIYKLFKEWKDTDTIKWLEVTVNYSEDSTLSSITITPKKLDWIGM
jgi:hypothetical protein